MTPPLFSSAAVKSLRIKINNTMLEKQDYLHAGDSPAFFARKKPSEEKETLLLIRLA